MSASGIVRAGVRTRSPTLKSSKHSWPLTSEAPGSLVNQDQLPELLALLEELLSVPGIPDRQDPVQDGRKLALVNEPDDPEQRGLARGGRPEDPEVPEEHVTQVGLWHVP